jgi:hypothetical protein
LWRVCVANDALAGRQLPSMTSTRRSCAHPDSLAPDASMAPREVVPSCERETPCRPR